MDRAIAITGVGIISSLGFNSRDYWENRKSNQDKSSEVTAFDTVNLKARKAYPILKFEPKTFIERRFIKPLDQVTKFCVSGSGLAIKDAKLEGTDKSRVGLVAGSKYHGIYSIFNIKETYQQGGVGEVSPVFFPGTVFNASGAQAAIEWKLTGPNCTVNTGMASGLTAIIKGVEYLLLNKATAMISGGNEMLFDYTMNKYDRLDRLSCGENDEEQCRPFDEKRNGMMLGEGACYFALESTESAQKRQVPVYAEIINYSYNYNPEEDNTFESFIDCMQQALIVNGEKYNDKIDLIVADGCGDLQLDMVVAKAIQATFNHNPFITSNKGCIGHTLGASGAFNLLDGVLCIQNQAVLPVQNLFDPILPLNFVTEFKETTIKNVLITSFDPDGNNACVLLRKA